jgi:hypothetical protein
MERLAKERTLWVKAQREHGLLCKERKKYAELHSVINNLEQKLEDNLIFTKFNQKVTPYCHLSKVGKYRKRLKLNEFFNSCVKKLPGDVNSCHVQINFEEGGVYSFTSQSLQTEVLSNDEIQSTEETELQRWEKIMSVKDRYKISDSALHELHMLVPDIPSLNGLKKLRATANVTIPIYSSEVHDFASRTLKDIVHYFLSQEKYQYISESDTPEIILRFSSDGCKLTKGLSSVRSVLQMVNPRDGPLPRISPQDEVTIYLYTGKYKEII